MQRHRTVVTLLLVALSLVATSATPVALQIDSDKAARKALKQEMKEQSKQMKSVLKDARKDLKDSLKDLQSDAKEGDVTAHEIAVRLHGEFTDFVALSKTLTAFAASEISFEAGAILEELQATTGPGHPVAFSPGSGADIDKGFAKLEKTHAKALKKARKLAKKARKKLAKEGFAVTVRMVDEIPVAIAPNSDGAFTALNFDTIIDVLVGVSRVDSKADGTLIVGGVSNPSKGLDVLVEIDGHFGIFHDDTTTIDGDRWTVTFDQGLPECNYRIRATHASTRVGTTIALR